MKQAISMILVVLMLLTFIGCVDRSSDNGTSTTPATTTITAPTTANSTTANTTKSTTIPTTQTTTAPTVFVHPGPMKTDDDLEYTPEDIPEVYWAVLNNQEAIYFPEGCTSHSRPCYAWLDDYKFAYDFIELAACDWAEYFVMDMDGDGSKELLIQASDTLLLREKDGIVYGYSFIFRQMMDVYEDGTFRYYYGGNGIETGITKISFKEDNNYKMIYLCEYRKYSNNGEADYFRIDGIDVTEEEYLDYERKHTSERVVWKKLGRYPIRKAMIPGG